MTNITYIIIGLIFVVGGLITAFGIPFLRAKLSTEQLTTLKQVANIAVYAAEQLFGAKMGKDKKAYALDYAKKLLAKFKPASKLKVLKFEFEFISKLYTVSTSQ